MLNFEIIRFPQLVRGFQIYSIRRAKRNPNEHSGLGKAEAKTGHQVNVSLDKVGVLGKNGLFSKQMCPELVPLRGFGQLRLNIHLSISIC